MSEESKENNEMQPGDQELAKALEEEKKRSSQYLTNLKYLQADFENYTKRTEKELREMDSISVGRVVMELLGVLDELELAIRNAGERDAQAQLVDGLKMVHRKFWAVLEREGLERIECLGKPFDPERHEAVERMGEEGDGVVVEELRKGFLFRGQVIRPSMVKVRLAAKQAAAKEVETSE